MSSNNQLIIWEDAGIFRLYHDFCVDNPFVPSENDLLGEFGDLKVAIEEANKFMETNIVKYGLDIRLENKELQKIKESGLEQNRKAREKIKKEETFAENLVEEIKDA